MSTDEEYLAELLEMGFEEDEALELLEGHERKIQERLELKDLPADVFIELVLDFLSKTDLICQYAIVGGMAYNRYLSEEYKIFTPDIDLKLFDVNEDSYLKCIENFIPQLQEYIMNKGFVWPFTLHLNRTLGIYQLKYGDNDVLDIGISDVPIDTVVIDDVNYATIDYLLSQLEKYRGIAAAFGMHLKEFRRQERKSNLKGSLEDIHMLDEDIYGRLCKECQTKTVEHLTGRELDCQDIRQQCEL